MTKDRQKVSWAREDEVIFSIVSRESGKEKPGNNVANPVARDLVQAGESIDFSAESKSKHSNRLGGSSALLAPNPISLFFVEWWVLFEFLSTLVHRMHCVSLPMENISVSEFKGPLFDINYFAWIECSIPFRLLAVLHFLLLLYMLKTTADEYLIGTFEIICSILNLSQEVAGSTLLAFGNGAPDMFSTIAAFTKSSEIKMGLGMGSLLGGSNFVLTLVLGGVILASPQRYVKSSFQVFGRDVCFMLLSLSLLLFLHWMKFQHMTVLVGLLFIFLYLGYVALVVDQARTAEALLEQQQSQLPLLTEPHCDVPPTSLLNSPIYLTDNYIPAPHSQPNYYVEMIWGDDSSAPQHTTTWRHLIQGLYWKQLKARTQLARYGDQVQEEWFTHSRFVRVFKILCFPLELCRSLTIPIPEHVHSFFLHPLCCTVLVMYLTEWISYWALAIALLISIVLFFCPLPNFSHVPQWNLLWASVSLCFCILWIFLLASEVVCLLNALGSLFEVSASLMGLSVLAWGNSVGDFVTNLALSRRGRSRMALSGCLSGPVFNLLFGFGTSFLVVSTKFYPDPVLIELDSYTVAVLIFMLFELSLLLVLAGYLEFQLNAMVGVFLGASYLLYLALLGVVDQLV
jgi:sodium/potassium/calcium exchanger 6